MQQHYDTTRLGRSMLSIALPTMAGFLLQSMYDVVDMIWVGRISSEAVAGVTIFSILLWIGTVLNETITSGSISILSQAFSKGDKENTRFLMEQSIGTNLVFSLLAAGLVFGFLHWTLPHFSTDPSIQAAATSYGIIRILFIPVLFLSYSLNTALRSVGQPKAPMLLMGISALMNVVLDPIFMFETIPWTTIPGFGMGVKGAAVATVIATVFSVIVGLILLKRKKAPVQIHLRGIFRLQKKSFLHFVKVGLPAGAENLFRNLLSLLLIRFISIYGTQAITAAGIGTRLFGFAYVPITGGFVAGSTMIAYLLGTDDTKNAKRAVHYAILLSLVGISILALLAGLFTGQLMNVFIDDVSVVTMGIPMIRILIPAVLMGAVSMGIASAFIGSGDNKPFLMASVIARWGVQPPMLFLTTHVFKGPITLVWWSFVVAGVVEIICLYLPYRKGHWLHFRV